MKLPKDGYDFSGETEEEWEAFARQQRIDEEALFVIDVDSLSEAQAKEALKWALLELDCISSWTRSTILKASGPDSNAYTGSTLDAAASLAWSVNGSHVTEQDRTASVSKANSERLKRPQWLKVAFKTAYDKYLLDTGKPPGRSNLEAYAIKAARAAGVAADDLDTISDRRLRDYLQFRKMHP